MKSRKIKILLVCAVFAVVMSCTMIFASAEGVTEMAPAAAASQIFGTLSNSINLTTILAVLGVALGAAIGIFLGWWGIRKVSRLVLDAFEKGRVKF